MSHEEILDPKQKNEIDDEIFHNQIDTNSEMERLITDIADSDSIEQIVHDANEHNGSKVKDYPSVEILEAESNSMEGPENDNNSNQISDVDSSKYFVNSAFQIKAKVLP